MANKMEMLHDDSFENATLKECVIMYLANLYKTEYSGINNPSDEAYIKASTITLSEWIEDIKESKDLNEYIESFDQ